MQTLIIVCDDSTRKYANYLLQLISSQELNGSSPGFGRTLDASVWSEKQYEASRAELSIATYILFVGNGKVSKEARSNIPMVFERVGMHYGWLGNQGCMFVDNSSLNRDNYAEFKQLCEQYGDGFDASVPRFEKAAKSIAAPEIPAEEVVVETIEDDGEQTPVAPDSEMDKALVQTFKRGAKEIVLTPKRVFSIISSVLSDSVDRVSVRVGAFLSSKEALHRQYTLLSLIMFKEGLPQFLGAL